MPTKRCQGATKIYLSEMLIRDQVSSYIVRAGHTINGAKWGKVIPGSQVAEIADAQAEPFPGIDNLLLTYRKLQSVMESAFQNLARGAQIRTVNLLDL